MRAISRVLTRLTPAPNRPVEGAVMTDPHHRKGDPPPLNIPVPDPSTLTTEALRDAIASLRALLEGQIESLARELGQFKENHEERHSSVVNAAIQHRKELSDASIAIVQTQVDAQFSAMQSQIRSMDNELNSKFTASDLRYQQRYDAQSQALDAAFEAQQKATAAALAAAKEAVQTAMTASQKAVDKAEITVEKLIPRAEVESRLSEFDNRIVRLAAVLETYGTLSDRLEQNTVAIQSLDRVTDAKFVTFQTLVDSQAEKVALALAASDRAVDNAFSSSKLAVDTALQTTAAATNKAETFNEKRFDIITKQIDELKSYRDATTGKGEGAGALWGYIAGGIGLLIAVTSIILAFNS
jgi:hypothetical protein